MASIAFFFWSLHNNRLSSQLDLTHLPLTGERIMKTHFCIAALAISTFTATGFAAIQRQVESAKFPNPAGKYDATQCVAKLAEGVAKEISVSAPDNKNSFYAVKLNLPEFVRGVAINCDKNWPSLTNRALPWTFSAGFKGLETPRGAVLLVLELPDGKTMVLLPITTPKQFAYFDIQGKTCFLASATFGTEKATGVSCLAACDNDPYRALSLVFEKAFTLPVFAGRFQARRTKVYPEMFNHLGWCSWEQYRLNITSNSLVKAAKEIKASGLPVRFFLVDDGHQVNRKKNRKLASFDPDPKTFPKGWGPLLDERDPKTLKWMGLWHAFHGNWEGLDLKNDFSPEVKQALSTFGTEKTKEKEKAKGKGKEKKKGKGKKKELGKTLLPGETDAASATFYNAFLGAVEKQGFDFVKIDVQTVTIGLYAGSKNPVASSIRNQKSLNAACVTNGLALLNCMSSGPQNTFYTGSSAVSRCSIDYKLN
ncbi:MAG: hypothetical protein HN909_02985, partial [Phycisphaerales bacterium]|nr:hypothetical protein [Phycisphaerales bacterium]